MKHGSPEWFDWLVSSSYRNGRMSAFTQAADLVEKRGMGDVAKEIRVLVVTEP